MIHFEGLSGCVGAVPDSFCYRLALVFTPLALGLSPSDSEPPVRIPITHYLSGPSP
jgi:hypothetical protein